MNKIWMMSSVAAAATVAAMVWGAQPARSSQDWLAKAQSEFATKARDAMIQRQIGQGVSQDQAAVQQMARNSAPEAAGAPAELPPATITKMTAPIETPLAESLKDQRAVNETMVLASAAPGTSSFAVGPAPENALPARRPEIPVALAPEVSHTATSGSTDPVAPLEPAEMAPSRARPKPAAAARTIQDAEPRESAPKARRATKQTTPVGTARRSRSDNSVEAQGMRALRQHSPELAAIVGRYMQTRSF
jgi:hypothetical protein